MKMIEVTRDAVVERGPRYKLIDGGEVNPRRLVFVAEAMGAVSTKETVVDAAVATPVILIEQFGVFREAPSGEIWSRRDAFQAAETGEAELRVAELM